jgi:hypothetical protein
MELGEAADACLKHILTLPISQRQRIHTLTRIAVLLLKRGVYETAGDAINTALQLDASTVHVRVLQGILALKQKNVSKAVKLLKTGIEDESQPEDAMLLPGQGYWLHEALKTKDPKLATLWLAADQKLREKFFRNGE